MDFLKDLVAHGLADILLALITMALGWVVQGLKESIKQHALTTQELHRAVNGLSVLIAREYVTKEDHTSANQALWGAINNLGTRVDTLTLGRGKGG